MSKRLQLGYLRTLRHVRNLSAGRRTCAVHRRAMPHLLTDAKGAPLKRLMDVRNGAALPLHLRLRIL